MRVAVLGPLQVTANDSAPVAVPGAQERLLLALLAAHAPDVVPVLRIAEVLGDGDAVRAAVRRLRVALEPGLPDRSSGQYVLRRGPGYALAVPRGDVDASRFTDLALRGSARLRTDPAEAEWALATALGLWRGVPYGDWPAAAFARAEGRRLEQIRHRAEADLQEAAALVGPRVVPASPSRRRTAGVPAVTVLDPSPQAWQPPPGPPSLPGPPPVSRGLPQAPATRTSTTRPLALIAALLVLLAAALSAARLSGRADQQSEQAATEADANRVAGMARAQTQLDVALVLAAQAFRLADTPVTRGALAAVLDGHQRVQRAVSFYGTPEDAVLSGGRTLTFGADVSVVGWPVGPATVPRVLMPIPDPWGAFLVAAPSPVEDVVFAAGLGLDGPWIRRLSTLYGTAELLLDGDAVGGRPVAGAVSPDGRRLLLVTAQQHDQDSGYSSTWQLVDVDTTTGARRDTGIGGVLSAPGDRIRADFAEDAGSLVVWNDTTSPPPSAALVQLADGRQVPLPAKRDQAGIRGFQAYPGGAVELWDDGGITLVDRGGRTVQDLGARQHPVLDVAVAPDGRWAVTGGTSGEVVRWDIDPATGRWSGREALRGHSGDVVSVEVDATGRLLATVSTDHTAITWDMSADGARTRPAAADPEARLRAACAIAGRDLTPTEWHLALPDRPWQPACTDLL